MTTTRTDQESRDAQAAADGLWALSNEAERRGDLAAAIRFAEEAERVGGDFVPYVTTDTVRA